MASSFDSATAFGAMMKKMYPAGKPAELGNRKHPIGNFLRRDTRLVGASVDFPCNLGSGGGSSADVSVAAAHTTDGQNRVWIMTVKKAYVEARLDRATIKLSKSPGAFAELLKHEVDTKLGELNDQLFANIMGSSSLSVGTIKTGTSTASVTIYLDEASSIKDLDIGDQIGVSAADGTGSLRGTPSYATITGLDREAGTLTFGTALASTISGATAGDYVFKKGNHAAGFSGIFDWCPISTPSSTTFNNIDRSVDPVRLAGTRVNGAGLDPADVLIDLCTKVTLYGSGSPDIVVVNPLLFAKLEKSGLTYERYEGGKNREIGFGSLIINHGGGTARVIQERFCPQSRVAALSMDKWVLRSAGEAPEIQKDPGSQLMFSTTADSYTVRMSYYALLQCFDPSAQGVAYNVGL